MTHSDLTTAPVPALIRRLAVPAGTGFFFNTMFNVVDTWYGGRLSTTALAAMSLSFPVFFILLAIGTSHQGIEYDSLDGEPVHVVIMVFAQVGNPGPHIEALAEISRLFSVPGFTEKVRAAKTPAEMLRLIRDQE